MRRATLLLVGMAALLRAQNDGVLEGTVTNSVTHSPLRGVSVSVTLVMAKGQPYEATTDDSGAYRITEMKPGQYATRFHKTGFLDHAPAGPFEPEIQVGQGGGPVRLDIQLAPLATLRGRVLDAEGKAAARVEVGYSEFDTSETGADGTFVLAEVPPGFYKLFAKPRPAADAVTKSGERTEVATTFYPAATNPAQAQSIQVRAGDDLSGFEIRLAVSPVYRVRGVVLDRAGNPAPRADVSLRSSSRISLTAGWGIPRSNGPGRGISFSTAKYFVSGGARLLQEADVETDEHGVFVFPSVRPGEWFLRAESAPASDGRTMSGGAPLVVTEKDVDGYQLRFSALFTLRGTVDWGDRPPPEGSRQAALMMVGDAAGPGGSGQALVSDGSVTVDALAPGRYRMVPMPGGPAGYYVASIWVGTRDVLGQAVELTQESPPVRIVYKQNAGRVQGTVEKGAGATVLLWSQPVGVPDVVRAATCDSRGAFQFDSVPPGDYSVVAFNRVKTGEDSDAFLRTVIPNAARASVDEGSTAIVQLPVTMWPE